MGKVFSQARKWAEAFSKPPFIFFRPILHVLEGLWEEVSPSKADFKLENEAFIQILPGKGLPRFAALFLRLQVSLFGHRLIG
jgi:hypothetical protein